MSENDVPVSEHRDVRRSVIQDARDGTTQAYTRKAEAIITTPNGDYFEQTIADLRTLDGRLIRDLTTEVVYACTVCGTNPWSQYAITYCAVCQRILCRATCRRPFGGNDLCSRHYRMALVRFLVRWVCRLS